LSEGDGSCCSRSGKLREETGRMGAAAKAMRKRIVSGVIGIPVLLALVLWPGGDYPYAGWPFAFLVLLLMLAGLREFFEGCRRGGFLPRDAVGYLGAVLLLAAALPALQDSVPDVLPLGLTLFVLVSLIAETLRPDRAPLRALGPTWLGVLYIGWLFPFAVRLRGQPWSGGTWVPPEEWMRAAGEGAWLVVFTILVTMFADTGAFLVGRSMGKHKLAPRLSPGKTWEGAVGGFLFAVLGAYLLGAWLRLPLALAVTGGTLIGLIAPLGDLSKSAIKREIGIKDFGGIIPGHGGVLDRFDSLLFTAPTIYWLMQAWLRQ
jgi:phosphatidate cytidylyltransferase